MSVCFFFFFFKSAHATERTTCGEATMAVRELELMDSSEPSLGLALLCTRL